jgi:hypothetical protein
MERFLDGLARGPARARRNVERRDREVVAEVHAHEAPLDVVLGHAEAAHDAVRLASRIDRDAAVAFFLRIDEGGTELGAIERLGRELMLLRLGFLQADDVGLLLVHPAEEALAGGRADAVEICRDDAEHAKELSR